MIVHAFDPGDRYGLASAVNGVLTYLDDANTIEDLLGKMRAMPRPDRVVVEKPTMATTGGPYRYGELRERAGEIVGIVRALWGDVPVLRPWPLPRDGEPGWQEVRAGYAGASKDASIAFVVAHLRRHGIDASVLRTARGRVRHDAADAGCMAVWGSEH